MKRLKTYFFPIFFLVCAIQVSAILYQIISYQKVLSSKNEIFLEVAPLDPYDMFRGRYVALRFVSDSITKDSEKNLFFYEYTEAYITFGETTNGTTLVKDIFKEKPTNGEPYLKVKASKNYGNRIYINYPFSRFYMQENLAKEADIFLANSWRETDDDNKKIVAKVKILNGKGVIEELYIGDKRFGTFLKENIEKNKKLRVVE